MDDDDDDNSPEIQKAKMKIMQAEFAEEMKKKTEKIKPRLIGCIWMNGDEDESGASFVNQEKSYHCSDVIWKILKAREAWTVEASIDFIVEKIEPEADDSEDTTEKPVKVTKTPQPNKQSAKAKFDETILKQLVRLLHGNVNGKKFIIKEFQAYRLKNFHNAPDFLEFSVKSVDEKIMEISEWKSCPDDGAMFGKKCWYVKQEIRQELFSDEQLPLPNKWTYYLEKEKKTKPKAANPDKPSTSPKNDEKIAAIASTSTATAATTPQPIAKKRVSLLMSVPLGEPVNETKKDEKISQFLKTNNSPTTSKSESAILKRPSPSKAETVKSEPPKKRVQLLMSVPLGENVNEKQKNQIMSQFLKKSDTKANVAAATSSAESTESKTIDPSKEIIEID